MKNIWTAIVACALFCMALQAYPIVFLPPVIYMVTFSLVAYVTNLFIFLAVWLAAKGVTDRLYLGRRMHELVKAFFQLLGNASVLVFSAVLPVLLFNPLTPTDVAFTSICAGVLCLAINFLSGYRKYRIVRGGEKIRSLTSMILLSALIVAVSYLSTSLALSTKVLYTQGREPAGDVYRDASAPPRLADIVERKAEAAGYLSAGVGVSDALWFFPVGDEVCSIYFNDSLLVAVKPGMNCYHYLDGKPERMYCPVVLKRGSLPSYGNPVSGRIYGTGSCSERYMVSIEATGFALKAGE